MVATPEGLRRNAKGEIISERGMLVLSEFSWPNSASAPKTTTVNLQINPGSQGVAYAVTLDVVEYNPSFAPMYQGVYGFANGVDSMNIGPGSCVTFSSIDLAPRGNISGSVDCDLTGRGVGNALQAAHLSGTFSSVFPY